MGDPPFDLASHVAVIEANRTVKDELLARLREPRPRRSIGVTDLTNPRKAYFQHRRPEVQPSLERRQAMFAGAGFHDLFGHAVSSEEYLEQTVLWEGVKGIIDLYKDVPTELKTTSRLRPDEDPRRSRPAYVEQLAMYCAMTDRRLGRLLVFDRGSSEAPPALSAYDLPLEDLDGVREEIRRRRDALRDALDRNDPSRLPRCPWFGRGCEYEGLCGCGDAPEEFEPTIARAAPALRANHELAAGLLRILERRQEGTPRRGLHALVMPRKAYFEAHDARETTDEERLADLERAGKARGLRDALELDRQERQWVQLGTIQDRVTRVRGVPTLVRSTRLSTLVDRSNVPRMFSHFLLRLAFDCALAGTDTGRLVLFYERLRDEESKLMVYDIRFRDVDRLRGEAERRHGLLAEALDGGADPRALPPCPRWMAQFCAYHPECGCAEDATA